MLAKFPNRTLKVGAKVTLSPDTAWDTRQPWNKIGVIGEVVELSPRYGELDLYVSWPGESNTFYNGRDYDLIPEGEPGFDELTSG